MLHRRWSRRLGPRRLGHRPRRKRRSALRPGLLGRHHRAQGARGRAASSRGRGLSREAALRVTRGSEPDGDRHDGSGRAGHVLEPGCGAVVRLEPGRGTGPQHRRARVGLGRAARGRRGGDPPGTRGRPCETDDPPNPQGRQAGRRRAAVGSPCRRRRSHRLPARLPRHHGREGGRDAVPPARRGAAARHLRRCAVCGSTTLAAPRSSGGACTSARSASRCSDTRRRTGATTRSGRRPSIRRIGSASWPSSDISRRPASR